VRMLKTAASKAAGEKEPQAYPLGYVEDCFEPRTKLGNWRVLARLGWAGDNVGIFSSRYSETGMNCLIHAPKLPGFRL
jgi:hypothetical protein